MRLRVRIGTGLGLALLAGAGAAIAIGASGRGRAATARSPSPAGAVRVRAARRLNHGSSLLAAAALTDSAIEHYRGSFHNRTMYLPLGVAAQALVAGLHGTADGAGAAHTLRHLGQAVAFATGIAGTGFHLYNITKRPGGFGWLNLFYAAPLGAPASLSLAGMLGMLAERVRDGGETICGVAPDRLTAILVAVGLVGTSGEAALLHFRGAYHNPAMVIPVVAPPVVAGLLVQAALSSPQSLEPARWGLRALVGVGFVGSAFHAYGIHRNMGGWRNWSQNLLNGPPLPAPPSFTALALAGLAALTLIEEVR